MVLDFNSRLEKSFISTYIVLRCKSAFYSPMLKIRNNLTFYNISNIHKACKCLTTPYYQRKKYMDVGCTYIYCNVNSFYWSVYTHMPNQVSFTEHKIIDGIEIFHSYVRTPLNLLDFKIGIFVDILTSTLFFFSKMRLLSH